MPVKRCESCGIERYTNGKALLCAKCEKERRHNQIREDWYNKLLEFNYEIIQFDTSRGSHSQVTVKNNDCGCTFTAKLNNILSRKTVCGACGPTKRMETALKHYIAKYGREYDLTKWLDYRGYVYQLSDEVYDKVNRDSK